MSNLADTVEQACDAESGCDVIETVLKPKEKDLGGFSVRRTLPSVGKKMIGPWVFFDHMGPADFPAGQGINVRPHPHIGIATVTYLFEGEILHRDSLGNTQAIRPGDINLMVAGRGITHSERERSEVNKVDHRLHGLQLWLALPEEQEECAPAFYHYPDADIPRCEVDGVVIRVMMGSAYGETSPVMTYSDTLYAEAFLQAGQSLILPDYEELGLYVAAGQVNVGGTDIVEYAMAVLGDANGVIVTALEKSRIALIGGKALPPRFIDWNFVSSRQERIEQAKREWRAGRFAKVVDDEVEFIPLPG